MYRKFIGSLLIVGALALPTVSLAQSTGGGGAPPLPSSTGASTGGGALPSSWGSIYYSPTSKTYGYSSPHSTSEAAEAAAYASCAARGTGCHKSITHSNNCAALALSPRGASGAASSANVEQAKIRALELCNKNATSPCSVVREQCTGVPAMTAARSAPAAAGSVRWGAIYYSPTTRESGAGWKAVDSNAAEALALKQCLTHASSCQKAVAFANGCGAVAVALNGGWGSGVGTLQRTADAAAVSKCQQLSKTDCLVIRRGCSAPGMP